MLNSVESQLIVYIFLCTKCKIETFVSSFKALIYEFRKKKFVFNFLESLYRKFMVLIFEFQIISID